MSWSAMSLTSKSHSASQWGQKKSFFLADLNTSSICRLLKITLPKIVLRCLGRQIGTFASACFKAQPVSEGISVTAQQIPPQEPVRTQGQRKNHTAWETKSEGDERGTPKWCQNVEVRWLAMLVEDSTRISLRLSVLFFPLLHAKQKTFREVQGQRDRQK